LTPTPADTVRRSRRRIAYAAVPALGHDYPGHPEHAGRVPAIVDDLATAGRLAELIALTPAPAPHAALARVHDPAYLEQLAETAGRSTRHLDADTYVTAVSWDAARLAAGASISAVDSVLDGVADVALSLARPPGHHALPDRAMGFCLLNNVAISARHAQARGLERVLIVDFDVHHGNGTQAVFWVDDSVLYVSTHQSGIYPGTGAEHEIGDGAGRGYTLNVPLPALAGDTALGHVWDALIAPHIERFQPQLVLASAGFDAHFRDPLAFLQVTGPGYHALAERLAALADHWADGRLVFVLEGGYDLAALANGVLNVVNALSGLPPDGSLGAAPSPEPDISALVERLRRRSAGPPA
jgi:acetoin utilization deacetylase AcuC-like enzyme